MDENVKYAVELVLGKRKEYYFNLWLVWKCKVVQNYKYIFATDSGLMIEATYNGDADELYVDMYRKEHKETIKEFEKRS